MKFHAVFWLGKFHNEFHEKYVHPSRRLGSDPGFDNTVANPGVLCIIRINIYYVFIMYLLLGIVRQKVVSKTLGKR